MNNDKTIPSASAALPAPIWKTLLGVFALSFGYMALRFILSPVQIRVLTSLLTKEQYGTLTLTMMTVSFLVTVSSMGHFEYLVRRLPGYPDAYQRGVLKLVTRFFGLLAISIAVIGVTAITLFHPVKIAFTGAQLLAGGLAMVVLVYLLQRIFYLLARSEWFRVRTLQLLYTDSWFLPLLLALVFVPASLTLVLWVWAGWVSVAAFVAGRWLHSTASAGPVSGARSPVRLGEILKYGMPLLPLLLGEWLFRLGDRYVLLAVRNLTAVANYSLCFNVALIVYAVAASVQDLFIPVLNRERNLLDTFRLEELLASKKLRSIFTIMLRYGLLLAFPGGLFLLLCPVQLLAIVSGAKFRDAAFILPYLSIMPLAFLLGMIFNQVQLLLNRSLAVGAISLAVAVLNVLFNIALDPRWGEIGAALAITVSLTIVALCAGVMIRVWRWIVWRELKPWRLAALVTVGGLGMYGARIWMAGHPLVCVLICGLWDALWIVALGLVHVEDFATLSRKDRPVTPMVSVIPDAPD